jgi:uncharacterized membrane protein
MGEANRIGRDATSREILEPATNHPGEKMIFARRLRPHRALDRRGRRCVLGFFLLLQAPGAAFLAMLGAWPAALFVVAAWAGLSLAFARNARDARAYEDISLSPLELFYSRVNALGGRRDWRFNPLWVRLDVARHVEFGMERLEFRSRLAQLEVGAFLGRAEKTRLAEELDAALAQARKGPRFP